MLRQNQNATLISSPGTGTAGLQVWPVALTKGLVIGARRTTRRGDRDSAGAGTPPRAAPPAVGGGAGGADREVAEIDAD